MGTTIRREPNLTALPTRVSPHYENIINFKGLHITDNPLTADRSSASDMLNVYIDDNNALTVRPRLEKTDDFDSVINGYTLIKVEPLKNGEILLLLNGNTPVIKLIINGTPYIVSGISDINVNTCTFYEDGDISVDGKIYLFDENGAKYIMKDDDEYVGGDISDIAYVPTVEVHKDLVLGKTTKAEQYNAFTNKYKISYTTMETPFSTLNDNVVGKKITLNTSFNDNEYTLTPSNIESVGFYRTPSYRKTSVESFNHISMSNDGKTMLFVLKPTGYVYKSTDYGVTFEKLTCTINGLEFIPTNIEKAWVSGDGTTIITLSTSGILSRYKNGIYVAEKDLSNLVIGNTTYSYLITASTTISYLSNITLSMNNVGNKIVFNYLFTNNDSTTMYIMVTNEDFTTITPYALSLMSQPAGNTTYLSMSDDGTYCAYWGIGSGLIDTTKPYAGSGTYINPRGFVYDDNGRSRTVTVSSAPNNVLWLNDTTIIFNAVERTNKTVILQIKDSTAMYNNTFTFIPVTRVNSIVFRLNNYVYVSNYSGRMIKYELTFEDNEYQIVDEGEGVDVNTTIPSQYIYDNNVIVKSGIFYNYQGNYIYTSNNYTTAKDWLTVEYDNHETSYNIKNATNYAVWRDSLWLYGVKNLLGWSGINADKKRDFTYFPENQIFEVGIDTTPVNEKSDITGFNIIGDNVASAYKRNKIYLITPTTISGVDTYVYSECKAEQGNSVIGETVTTPLTALPIQVNRDGVFALTNLTNVYAADKVATLISGKINEKFLKEDLSNLKLIAFKYWLFIFIPAENTKVYVYDDRTQEWFYWELPIEVLNVFKTHDNLCCASTNNIVYKLNPKEKNVAINADDAVTLYYDDVYTEGEDNCFDAYGVQGKHIVWYWTSQISPLSTISYAKQLNKTTFIVADSDSSDGYAFNYSIKGWRKKRTLVKSSDLDGTVYSVQATTKRTNINRAHFIQLTVTNAMLENHQLMLNKTLKTDIDTNDQKVRLISVSMKYKLLEV